MSPRHAPKDKITLRIDPDLHDELIAAAYWLRITKTDAVDNALRDWLDAVAHRLGGQIEPMPDGQALPPGSRPRDPQARRRSRPAPVTGTGRADS